MFNADSFIGYVNEVTRSGVRVHYPRANLSLSFFRNGANFLGGNVGCFVLIEGQRFGFFAQVQRLVLPDSERKLLSEDRIQNSETLFHPIADVELLLSFDLVDPDRIERTISRHPEIGSKVYSCSECQIRRFISHCSRKIQQDLPELARMSHTNIPCSPSPDDLFSRHCAVLGTTGGGKSWTMSRLMEILLKATKNKFILIDPTGEYKNFCSSQLVNAGFGDNTFLDYNSLSKYEVCALLRESSPNTVAALCDAIDSLKLRSLNAFDGVKAGKRQSDIVSLRKRYFAQLSDQIYDIKMLPEQLDNECVKPNASGMLVKDEFKAGYCSHLMNRLHQFLVNPVFVRALAIDERDGREDIVTTIQKFLADESKQVLRISFEKLSFDCSIREIMVNYIANCLLDLARNGKFRSSPIVFIVDEAHEFVNKSVGTDSGAWYPLDKVDFIAKEGRKYGLFLCLATQMPRDIPAGILSQIGTFIIHRLINEQDRHAVENACLSANKSVMSVLPGLGAGEAILLGVQIPMPLLVNIVPPVSRPSSETPGFTYMKSSD